MACAQPSEYCGYECGVPNVSSRSRRNSGVSMSLMPVMVSASFQVPFTVPSPEAPLSPVIRRMSVSSSTPSSSTASTTCPMQWSVCSRKAAYSSICLASTGFVPSGISDHAGMPSWRAVSSASGGTTPSRFCRAKVSSRTASHPWSNSPA